jgi:long-chain-fatty-acid--CoA ligase ACSBG
MVEDLDFRITDPTKRIKIRQNPDSAVANIDPVTVPEVLRKIASEHPDHPALKQRNVITKDWETITYADYKQRVEKMAKVFIKLGLERHGTVAVLAFNSAEWFIAELAAIHAGGIATGIYTTNSVHSTLHVLESSRANIVVVDEAKQMEKIREIKDKLPNLKAVVQTLSPYAPYIKKEDGYWRWSEIELINTDDVEDEYQARLKSISAAECCCLVYTSGTTGINNDFDSSAHTLLTQNFFANFRQPERRNALAR